MEGHVKTLHFRPKVRSKPFNKDWSWSCQSFRPQQVKSCQPFLCLLNRISWKVYKNRQKQEFLFSGTDLPISARHAKLLFYSHYNSTASQRKSILVLFTFYRKSNISGSAFVLKMEIVFFFLMKAKLFISVSNMRL